MQMTMKAGKVERSSVRMRGVLMKTLGQYANIHNLTCNYK